MALRKRKREQLELWVATTDLPRSPGHPFYRKLNELLAEAGFDAWIEKLCEPHYAQEGRPSIPPGVYFRMILVGYFGGDRLATWHRLAVQRQPLAGRVPGPGGDG